jgi:nitrate reductase assembly molybdenum cofactor insertion protein NarJ
MRHPEVYASLATLFVYPDSEYRVRTRQVVEEITKLFPAATESLSRFYGNLPELTGEGAEERLNSFQELYARSFEVQPITTLDLGYVCFGDDYKRGELMVNLIRVQRRYGVETGTELSDHLPNVLKLLSVWDEEEMVEELIQQIVWPALDSIIGEFDERRIRQRNILYRKHQKTLIDVDPDRPTMFVDLLIAICEVIGSEYERAVLARPAQSYNFLKSIRREFEVEDAGAGRRPSADLDASIGSSKNSCSMRFEL